MMPGPHIPPGRRQAEQYHHYQYPQTHSPVHHNPYAQPYYHPQQYGPPHGYPQHIAPMQQWYPYQQPPPPPPQYAMPPRQFQPHASPVVVSSHLHMAPPVNRSMGHTPPIVHSHTPPMPHMQTPQPAPSTPSVQSQTHLSASTPPTNMSVETPPPTAETKPAQAAPASPKSTTFTPFYPPLPWLSVSDADFPPRASRRRRRRRAPVSNDEEGLALPSREQAAEEEVATTDEAHVGDGELTPTEEREESQASTIAVPSDIEVDTPSTSHPPSEIDAVQADAPAIMAPLAQSSAVTTKHARNTTRPAVPLIPIRAAKPQSAVSTTQQSVKSPPASQTEPTSAAAPEVNGSAEETPKASPPKPVAPKSWAELLRAKNAPAVAAQPSAAPSGVAAPVNGPPAPKSNTLADVLASFSVDSDKKVSFIEPRGLVNTGNLCYMNSVSVQRS